MASVCRFRSCDRGQALPLTAAAMALALACALLVSTVGARAADAARAQTAADAAALAGVDGGRSAARDMARDNGGHLEAFRDVGRVVEVEVTVGTATAVARAARLPPGLGVCGYEVCIP